MPAPASWIRQADQAKTGGHSTPITHSAQGTWPSGCCQRSPRMKRSWSAASWRVDQRRNDGLEAVSQVASQGNSHVSGMIRTSSRVHLSVPGRVVGRGPVPGVEALAPQQAHEGLAVDVLVLR